MFDSAVQLLSLVEKLSPALLSALEDDSRMSRLFACRSVATILERIGKSLHPDVLNKIYPGKRCVYNKIKAAGLSLICFICAQSC